MYIKQKLVYCLLIPFLLVSGVSYASIGTEIKDVQQQRQLTGIVTDDEGPAIGVSVSVKGTTTGVITDADGKFVLSNVPNNSTIVISFIGYITQEIKYTGQRTLNVNLKPSDTVLQETVVTALGIARDQKALGFATSSIKSDELSKMGVTTNPLSALYGKAAGVGIQASASGPTGGINIKIRGAARLDPNQNTRPLFVVDGMPIYDTESSMAIRGYDPLNSFDYGSGINDINPEDIESIDILKGAKASVLYGSAGANGVVLITTKKGTGTRGLGISLTYNHIWHEPISFIDWQNDYGSGEHQYFLDVNENKIKASSYNWGTKFDGRDIEYWDGSKRQYVAYKNNWNDIWKTGHSDVTTIAITGGSDKGSMRLSYTNNNYSGILPNHSQRRNNFSFSGRMNASDLARFEVNTNLYKIKTQNRYPNTEQLMSVGNNRDNDYQTLAANYVSPEGYRNSKYLTDQGVSAYQQRLANLLWHQNYNRNVDDKTHLIANLKADFQVHPLISVTTFAGIDYTQTDYTRKEKVTDKDPDLVLSGGKYRFDTEQIEKYNLRASLNYDQAFMSDRLRVTAFAGPEYQSLKGYNIYASTYGPFNFDDWYSLNNSSSWPSFEDRGKVMGHKRYVESQYSIFGDATISLDDKYYLNLNLRNDWTSTLQRGFNSYFYAGVSFNYNFEQDLNWTPLTFGKVRVNWANVGAPAGRYFALNNDDLGKISGTDATTVTPPDVLFSGILKPERKKEYEFGLDLRFFPDDRLYADFSIYTHDIYNQIMKVDLTSTTGFNGIRINAGNVRTWGYEFMLKGAILSDRAKGYRWEVAWNTSNLYTKVKKLYPGVNQNIINPGKNGWSIVAREGERSGQILAPQYKYDDNGNKIVGVNGLYELDSNDRQVIGNAQPDFFGGFSTDFYYKNFSINVGIDYSFGGYIISKSNHYLLASGSVKQTLGGRDEASGGLAYYKNKDGNVIPWEHGKAAPAESQDGYVYHDGMILPGVMWDEAQEKYVDNTKMIPIRSYWMRLWQDNETGALDPEHIYKNNYMKMRNVAISYTLPKKVSESLKLQKVTLTASAQNLFYLYKSVKNVDAESTLGTDNVVEYANFPIQRSWGLKINVSF